MLLTGVLMVLIVALEYTPFLKLKTQFYKYNEPTFRAEMIRILMKSLMLAPNQNEYQYSDFKCAVKGCKYHITA